MQNKMDYLTKLRNLAVFKTIWINFHTLPLRQALRFPIVLARGTKIGHCPKGSISLPDGGTFHVGFHCYNTIFPQKSCLSIDGKLILTGKGTHSFSQGLILKIGKNAVLRIGNNFSCHRNNTFIVNKLVVIGDDNMFSFEVATMDTDSHVIFDEEGSIQNPNREILIGDRVWIGCRNTILKGARIPDGCVLGSGGVITKMLGKSSSIYLGNKLLRERIIWSRAQNIESLEPEFTSFDRE